MTDLRCLLIVTILILGALLALFAIVWALWWLGVFVSALFHWAHAVYPPLVVPLSVCCMGGLLAGVERGAGALGL